MRSLPLTPRGNYVSSRSVLKVSISQRRLQLGVSLDRFQAALTDFSGGNRQSEELWQNTDCFPSRRPGLQAGLWAPMFKHSHPDPDQRGLCHTAFKNQSTRFGGQAELESPCACLQLSTLPTIGPRPLPCLLILEVIFVIFRIKFHGPVRIKTATRRMIHSGSCKL